MSPEHAAVTAALAIALAREAISLLDKRRRRRGKLRTRRDDLNR